MQSFNFINLIKSLKSYENIIVILKKIYLRLFGTKNDQNFIDYLKYLKENSVNYESFFSNIDSNLWDESKNISKTINDNSKKILENIKFDLGGGGSIEVVYFLTRLTKPNNIIETGVAAGFTTYAFFEAIKKNNKGNLFSSDFPYFRLPNPEQFIGIILPNHFRLNWNLFIKGDENNIKEIKKKINTVDLIHYDSDKSYNGRKNFIKSISDITHKETFFIMDDLHDNSFFLDYVKENKELNWKILNVKKGFVGLIYPESFKSYLK
tara:strand:+ start:435 stop:1229 length:795 start_codon:yes stop_codon:yes gene_type:complete